MLSFHHIYKKNKYFLIVFILISQFSFSQEEISDTKHPLLTDNFVFRVGNFTPFKSIGANVNGSLIDENDEIDLGAAFNLKNYQSTFSFEFDWRFSKKWKFIADYYGINDSNTAILDEEIIWEDVKYNVGAEVKLNAKVSVIRTFIGRSFSQGLKHEFGAGIGLHAMIFDISLEGQASIADGTEEEETGFQRVAIDGTAPLPDIGLWYYWAPSTKWSFTADVDWLYVTFGEFQGGLWDIQTGVQYQIVDFFGVGLNYKYYAVNIDVDTSEWNGGLDITYNGPMLMLNFNF